MQTQRNRVLIHFNDGTLLKGYTHDFVPERDAFHLILPGGEGTDASREIRTTDLKAVFFLKTFEGNREYVEKQDFKDVPASASHGLKIKVEFRDGEVLRGFSLGYNKTKKGFFIIPIDPGSNNERIYVVAASTDRVTVGPGAEA